MNTKEYAKMMRIAKRDQFAKYYDGGKDPLGSENFSWHYWEKYIFTRRVEEIFHVKTFQVKDLSPGERVRRYLAAGVKVEKDRDDSQKVGGWREVGHAYLMSRFSYTGVADGVFMGCRNQGRITLSTSFFIWDTSDGVHHLLDDTQRFDA